MNVARSIWKRCGRIVATQAVMLCSVWLFAGLDARAQDFQSWNEVDLTASWSRADLTLPFVARTDSRLPNPQLAATGCLLDVHMRWRLTLTGGYLFVDLPQRSPSLVHVPLVAVTEAFHLGQLTFADRNRFEKLVGFGSSPVRYRNRLLVDLPFGAHESWHVFAEDEVFFDFSASRWNQNRAQAGGGARLSPRFFLDVYFLQRDTHGGGPETRVLGTTLKLSLKPK